MNKAGYRYLPFIVYSLFLLILWVTSWVLGLVGLFVHLEGEYSSLFSGEGVRWTLYTALQSVDAAPWGAIVIAVVAVGVVAASGICSTIMDVLLFRRLSAIRRYAGLFSLVIFILAVALLLTASVSPWRFLSGVTKDWGTSAIVQGWIFIVLIVSLAVSLMHGSVCGYYRSIGDVVRGLCSLFPLFAPAFLAILPASGIVPCVEYVGLITFDEPQVVSDTLCWLPFVFIAFVELGYAVKRNS